MIGPLLAIAWAAGWFGFAIAGMPVVSGCWFIGGILLVGCLFEPDGTPRWWGHDHGSPWGRP